MKHHVTIIDYGVGNLLSVKRAFEKSGAEVSFTDTAKGIDQATKLVLPGVAAFIDGMNNLAEKNLIGAIKDYVRSGRPFAGICLGMQLLLENSVEFGSCEGLGLIPGEVKLIPSVTEDGRPHKIPHIGWNNVTPLQEDQWSSTLLEGFNNPSSFYFLHSFTAWPKDPKHRLADCRYNGQLISAAVKKDNVYGFQFHPEKSGVNGLRLIENFVRS